MKDNNFVFADVSAYDLKAATYFYTQVFDWSYTHSGDHYFIAKYKNKEVSGLYETPQKFKDLNMPSFWMSYIQVAKIDDTIKKAKALGGIVELVDKNQSICKIALIRDPLGAGFTIYEGSLLNSRYENEQHTLVWNELFISDFSKIKSFYEGIFNWTFQKTKNNRYLIHNTRHNTIGAIQELSDDIKGKKEYWSVFFGVKNPSETKAKALKNEGKLIYEDTNTTVLADPLGAFFHIVPINKHSFMKNKNSIFYMLQTSKWKAILGLLLIALYLTTNVVWIWSVFFASWIISDIRSGRTHLFEPLSRKDTPFLYWAVLTIWALLGAYSIVYYA